MQNPTNSTSHLVPLSSQSRPVAEYPYEAFIVLVTFGAVFINLPLLFFTTGTPLYNLFLAMDSLFCLVFFLDFLRSLAKAERKLQYLRWGWLDLVGSIPVSPVLRIARLARVLRSVRAFREAKMKAIEAEVRAQPAQTTLLGTILLAFLVLFVGSVMVFNFEHAAIESNIQSPADAFWWAFVTMATVGYGDYYPVTESGRIVAMGLMTVGVSIFGVLSSYLASSFINRQPRTAAENYANLTAEITSLRAIVDQYRSSQEVQEQEDRVLLQKNLAAIREELAAIHQELQRRNKST